MKKIRYQSIFLQNLNCFFAWSHRLFTRFPLSILMHKLVDIYTHLWIQNNLFWHEINTFFQLWIQWDSFLHQFWFEFFYLVFFPCSIYVWHESNTLFFLLQFTIQLGFTLCHHHQQSCMFFTDWGQRSRLKKKQAQDFKFKFYYMHFVASLWPFLIRFDIINKFTILHFSLIRWVFFSCFSLIATMNQLVKRLPCMQGVEVWIPAETDLSLNR